MVCIIITTQKECLLIRKIRRHRNENTAIVLVGGKRTGLHPLVEQRCKAAVPVFGKYRIIDFTLSNLI
jgi:ADP-glucose pyrophosphorylase